MSQAIVTATGLSSSLKSALAKIENAQPGEQLSISSKTMAEARDVAAGVDDALKAAPTEAAERWLEALGVLCAQSPHEADAMRKIRAMALMLQFPARCFNRASLDAAARKFKFFPAYAELCEHLEAEASELKRLRHDLRRLMALPVVDAQPRGRWSEMTSEQRAEFDRLMSGFRGTRTDEDGKPLEGAQDA